MNLVKKLDAVFLLNLVGEMSQRNSCHTKSCCMSLEKEMNSSGNNGRMKLCAVRLMLCILLSASCADLNTNDELGKSTAELIRLRGFKAIDHYVTTTDGYILNLVQGLSPLVNDGERGLAEKDPILFGHGALSNANCFLVNSDKARPKYYASLNPGNMSLTELRELLDNDPAANSLPFTAMNFGHEVWLINRRGTLQSLGHVRKSHSSLRPEILRRFLSRSKLHSGRRRNRANVEILEKKNYWDFSLDELARYDFPAIIEYVLEKTERTKLTYVGHSAGATIPLMSLTIYPELADKFTKALFLAPALYPTSFELKIFGLTLGEQLNRYVGPVPGPKITPLIEAAGAALCESELAQKSICEPFARFFVGFSGGADKVLPGYLRSIPDSMSSHFLNHLFQAANKGKMHHYDFLDDKKNEAIYGQPTPPVYDISKIRLQTMSFWAGFTDGLVPEKSVERLISDLSVPAEFHTIGEPGVYFDHFSFLIHENVSKLLTIPALRTLA